MCGSISLSLAQLCLIWVASIEVLSTRQESTVTTESEQQTNPQEFQFLMCISLNKTTNKQNTCIINAPHITFPLLIFSPPQVLSLLLPHPQPSTDKWPPHPPTGPFLCPPLYQLHYRPLCILPSSLLSGLAFSYLFSELASLRNLSLDLAAAPKETSVGQSRQTHINPGHKRLMGKPAC